MIDKREISEGEAFVADESAKGERLDSFIASQLPEHVSRSRVKDIVKQGGVSVNDAVNESPNYRLKSGDVISVIVPDPVDAVPKPQPIPLDIHYEDSDLLVVNKPAGLVVHPAIGNWTGTLVNGLLHHCGASLSGIGGVRRPGIVHRLDKDTSGLMVVAKNEATHVGLSDQFKDHGRNGPLERSYMALVWGCPSPKAGTIDTFLARSPSNRKKRAVVSQSRADAKQAVTHYSVVEAYDVGQDSPMQVSLVKCRLETGRTHQIRVHMSHIGHPLLGDPDYGKHFQTKIAKLDPECRKAVEGFRRQALHAEVLGFEHPKTGEFLKFQVEPSKDFAELLQFLRKFDNSQ